MEPLVSILIPSHNSEEWIADTINSALAQTWSRKEIIVVDDGSTDGTLAIARQFVARNVQVISQDNRGAAGARNIAFAACQGDYIQWLDADDLLEPDKVERQARRIAEGSSRTLLSGAWAYFRYRTSQAQFTPTRLWADLSPADWLVIKMGDNLHMQTDNWLVSRELTAAAGPWNESLWRDNDGEYFSRVILASDGVRFVPEARSYYRKVGSSSVSYIGRSNRKIESMFLSMTLHMQYLRSLEDSARTRDACCRYISTWLHEFYPDRTDLGEQLQHLARELGGRVDPPRLSWKYNWLIGLFGWNVARHAQLLGPRLRSALLSSWDQAMFRIQRQP